MRIASFMLFVGAGVVLAAACTNDFDRFDFDGEGGAGGLGPVSVSVSVSSVGGATSTSVSSTGGMGGCSSALECPGLDTDCRQRSCVGGICGFADQPAGTPCNDDGGNLCDGFGFCVQCLNDIDCEPLGGGVCDNGVCLPADCADGLLNNDETDVDCGGSCDPCMDGDACLLPDDCQSGVCTGNVCVPCVTAGDCAALHWCDAGSCAPQGVAGDPCTVGESCQSGFCPADDAICCDTACDGLCESCAMADTGAADGTCAAVTAGTDPKSECTLSAATCSQDVCSGVAGQCEPSPSSVTCRASQGLCDVPESCDGISTGCPADAKQPSTAVCRLAVDLCDATETCDGLSNTCPPDLLQPSTFTCRIQAGPCDVAETCDGLTTACPTDAFVADGAPSSGNLCNPYLCDGNQAACPTSCSASGDCVTPTTCVSTTCQ